MGKGANNSDARRVDVRLTAELADYVDSLARLGLMGGSAPEVIRYFVKEGVEKAIRDRVVENVLRDRALMKDLVTR